MKIEKYLAILAGGIACFLVFQGNDISLFLGEARDVLSLHSPYHVPQAINPLSVALIFAPLSSLPDITVLRIISFISVTIYAYAIFREKHWATALLFVVSPLFLYNIYYANLDWTAVLSLLVSPIPAFFLALIKPQVGWGVAVIAILSVWKRNKKLAIFLIAIEGGIYLASFAWGMRWEYALTNSNYSIFPYGCIIGIPLMSYALYKKNTIVALGAAPFLSPYVGPQSWIVILPMLARYTSPIAQYLLHHRVRIATTDSSKAQTYSYQISQSSQ